MISVASGKKCATLRITESLFPTSSCHFSLSLSLSLSLSNILFYSFTLIYSPPSSLNISLSLDKLSML